MLFRSQDRASSRTANSFVYSMEWNSPAVRSKFRRIPAAVPAPAPAAAPASISEAADDLLKLKELLDAGILTQEEFDAKKKQLLGL